MTYLNAKHARRRTLGTAISLALASAFAAPAHAIEFSHGDWNGTIDTTLSYGASMRLQQRDQELVGLANINPFVAATPITDQINAPGRFSVNGDDGNLNYDDGDLFSNAFKITSEFSLNYKENSGAFARASYFYDWENADRADLTEEAREKVGTRLTLLDAFVFHNMDLGGHETSVRVGRQAVSWGESTFIQNGINVVNPIDVSKLRVAGAELKEAFLPVDMIQASFAVNENLSVEALYLLEFEQTEPDPMGTYFSTNDFATLGADFVMLGFGRANEPANFANCGNVLRFSSDALERASCLQAIPRLPDDYADDNGQYGAALRYFSPTLNDTEFGFFFLNYHSRLPLLSGYAVTSTLPNSGRNIVEYPEDIRMYGMSFNTTLGDTGIALQGELSYRDNMPLQFDDVELLFSALSPLNPFIPAPGNRFISQLGEYGPGDYVRGWERHEVSQLQFTLTKAFGPGNWLGAQQIATVAEFGGTEVWDLPSPDLLRYQGDGTDTGCGGDLLTGGALVNPVSQCDGFPTRFSWGYRLAARADYNNVFGSPFNMSPRLAFNHDVNGITPGPGGNFLEGRKSLTVGVEATYLNQWAADLSYTEFRGAGHLNLIHDRDFVSFTVKYSF
ncbi:MAG: DUF1302 domain-containing protein [Xanthomonadales bacterium]|nr:DUF1302 domain-containing protein [Xanthomonadales bacterium]MBP6079067.1 DUF1302 domain-containing protein [Xanthomonadales bacterium]MBP7623261.1 DUF1302 domain-containing protein [Xanthomonadales bacterium]